MNGKLPNKNRGNYRDVQSLAQILNNKQKEGKNIVGEILIRKLELPCESGLCDKKLMSYAKCYLYWKLSNKF